MQITTKEDAIKRLKIIKGHLEKVTEMVDGEKYCPEILQQTAAVQSALKKVDEILLKGHLEACVKEAVKNGGGQKQLDEIIEVFRKR